jgi:hypothetical protein
LATALADAANRRFMAPVDDPEFAAEDEHRARGDAARGPNGGYVAAAIGPVAGNSQPVSAAATLFSLALAVRVFQ